MRTRIAALRSRAKASYHVRSPTGREESLERYQERVGRPVGDLTWYEAFALLRSAAILVRMQRLLVEQGQADHWLVGFDPVPPRLLELTAP